MRLGDKTRWYRPKMCQRCEKGIDELSELPATDELFVAATQAKCNSSVTRFRASQCSVNERCAVMQLETMTALRSEEAAQARSSKPHYRREACRTVASGTPTVASSLPHCKQQGL